MLSDVQGTEIRSAAEADRPAIRDITFAAYDEYRASMPPQGWEMYAANIARTLDSVDPADCIVAVREGRIIGSVLLSPANAPVYGAPGGQLAEYPEVRLLAVPPAERGHGIGQALMDECKRRSLAVGATHLALHTNQLMQAALHIYEKMGFERAPETDFRPAPNALVMGFRLRLEGES